NKEHQSPAPSSPKPIESLNLDSHHTESSSLSYRDVDKQVTERILERNIKLNAQWLYV
ncbi:hypothetical protein Tco_0513132, partial [Tanacetum coccineum]